MIQRNQSAAFSSGKVRPNHETNINIIARRTGKDVNSHTVLDGIITTIMALPQLDINNTIDHRPEGDEKWFLENEKTVTQFCRKLAAERPLKDIRDEYNYPKKKGI